MALPESLPLRLHVGSGDRALPGWTNIDLKRLPGVDLVADVTDGLPFTGVDAIFAEHFLEHLTVLAAIDFIAEAHRVLRPDGKLRLSTPNLDWVWRTHYPLAGTPGERQTAALAANRAFYGWRHRFLWNRELLEAALDACGFVDLAWPAYGESQDPTMAGLERHGSYPDLPGCQHVLIAEARKGEPHDEALRRLKRHIHDEFVVHLPG